MDISTIFFFIILEIVFTEWFLMDISTFFLILNF